MCDEERVESIDVVRDRIRAQRVQRDAESILRDLDDSEEQRSPLDV
jgi:hypothetical protein